MLSGGRRVDARVGLNIREEQRHVEEGVARKRVLEVDVGKPTPHQKRGHGLPGSLEGVAEQGVAPPVVGGDQKQRLERLREVGREHGHAPSVSMRASR